MELTKAQCEWVMCVTHFVIFLAISSVINTLLLVALIVMGAR